VTASSAAGRPGRPRRGSLSTAEVDLTAHVGPLALPNPVMTAAGTSGHGAELSRYFDLSRLGAVVVKSLSAEPWAGNPPPRLLPLPAGMLNSVGLQNGGLGAWLADDLPRLARARARAVVSVWGRSPAEFAEVGRRLAAGLSEGSKAAEAGARAIVAVEANISCPNVEDRRRMFAHSPEATGLAIASLAGALAATGLPLWAKLSPNVTDLVEVAAAALEAGAGALTLVNTLMGLAMDPLTGRPRLGGGGGGVSGPALHPVAVRAVYECRRAFPGVPIVGVGGVMTGADAAELLAAGADAVQVGTATFADPRAPLRVLTELRAWCARHGIESLAAWRPAEGPGPGGPEDTARPGGPGPGGRNRTPIGGTHG
jgi:dihydroorotate dehydrogenase (NAD+) catalytic subunit